MNARKGHQGFTSKYKTLGDTKLMRVPVSISQDIKHMLVLLESISHEYGVDEVSTIMDRVNDSLAERLP